MVPDAQDVIAQKGAVLLNFRQEDLKGISDIESTPDGLDSSSIVGTCTNPRSFMVDKTSCTESLGRPFFMICDRFPFLPVRPALLPPHHPR